MGRICILGSINMDNVIDVPHIPKVGETVLGLNINKNPGGKGANQAVCASRLGSDVSIVGKVGKDENGKFLLKHLKDDNINMDYIFIDNENQTGIANISVDKEGNNSIVVVPGSNMNITEEEINRARDIIKSANIVVAQFEIPINIIIKGFEYAKENNITTILNPAPAKEIPDELFKVTDIIIPNEGEAYDITGIQVCNLDSAKMASQFFFDKGVSNTIITLGEKGAALIAKDRGCVLPAHCVKARDTTAAGDAFIGAFANKLSDQESFNFEILKECVKFGNLVSSITVQRLGAKNSLPYRRELMP